MGCNCGKPKCNGKCGISPSVLQINNNDCTLFHKVIIPASMGDDTTYPPKNGLYKNVLLFYEANGEAYLYSSDGIPTKVTGVATDYNILYNKPSINNVVLVGNKTLTDLGITGAIDDAVSAEAALRYAADQALEQEIDDLRNNPDVVDIVGTYAELQSYDTSKLTDNDIIKVLQDETKNDATTYYKWHKATGTWEYIGEQGPYYTKSQTDTLLAAKADISSLAPVATSGSYNDLTDKPTIGNATLTVQKNSATVGTFTANSTTDTTIDIAVPTKTSDLTNDGADGTSTYVELDDLDTPLLEGTGEFVTLNGTSDCTSLETTLYGNATQETLSGKNLMLFPPSSRTNNNVLWTITESTITASGTASGNWTFPTDYISFDTSLPAGTYTFSIPQALPNTFELNLNYGGGATGDFQITAGQTSVSFTTTAPASAYRFAYRAQYQVVSISMPNKLQLEAGSTATPYEPYCGGVPSPNPSYPQDVNVVSGAQTVKITGKNLWGGIGTLTRTSGHVDFTTDADGTIHADGTATSTAYSLNSALAVANGTYITLKAGTYRAYADIPAGAPYYLELRNVRSDTSVGSGGLGPNIHAKVFTLAETTDLSIRMVFSNGETADNISITPMITVGSEETSFEPYQGQSQEINLGKNLAPNNATSQTMNQVVFTKNDDGSITANGTADSTAFYPITDNFWLEAGTYTLSSTNQCTTTAFLQLIEVATGSPVLTNLNNTKSSSFTITNGKTARLYYRIASGAQVNLTVFPQLERGTLATTYAPYKTPIELAKIGTYQDYIWNDGGTWKIHEAIKKVELDGTESWNQVGGSTHSFWLSAPDSATPAISDVSPVLSDNFTASTYNDVYYGSVDYGVALSTSGRLALTVKDVSGVANFPTWLQSHNTTVYYALATPTDTEITDSELIAQLNALKDATGYDGVTNIFSTSPMLPAILDITAYKDSIIPVATTERAGIVKIGDNIDVDSCGVISAVDTTYTAGTGIDITGTTISGMTASVSGTTLILTNA